ncbi:hypothetical protein Lpp120_2525 [Lacticaseibacillus paracasei subsp. paracasei Lpp120]|nr:hypothetical protein Lpp120_2525 [Lacticaseibacillus paracasei subsp. paracasei Lpp120]KTE98163.1 hypothetical protein AC564_2159c [Lacticaseibacillus paracasei]OUC67712.1 hypothetical protein BWK52_2779c [Lacticaseibacillus paracasei]
MQTTQRPGFVADVVRRLRDRFLGSKRRHAFHPHLAGDCGVWHGKKLLA